MKSPTSRTSSATGLDALPGNLTPGMAALLRVGNGEPEGEVRSKAASVLPPFDNVVARRCLQGSLVGADLLLMTLAGWVILKANGPLGWGLTVLCVGSVMAGAWLSCLALWLESN